MKGFIIAAVAGLTVAPAPVYPLDPPNAPVTDTIDVYERWQRKAPILVLATSAEFGAYAQEILRAEGFNEFLAASPADPGLTAEYLSRFDVAILTETKLSAAQAELLTGYVRAGGNLIAFRPDKLLAPVFGLTGTGSTIANGYIKIHTQNALGMGFTRQTLQFHGAADGYELKGGTTVATLGQNVNATNGKPGIVSHQFGEGRALAFAYNLPKSIVLGRQGNPQAAGTEKDGINGIRAADMFTDGWLNPLKNGLNQGDEQMRLLSRAIERLNPKQPLPRFWYFPGRNRSLVTLTADGEDSPEEDFEAQLADVKSRGARLTLYLKGTYVSPAKVKKWIDDGFEIAAHVDDTEEAIGPTWRGMNAALGSTLQRFNENYGFRPRTVRNHWVVWCGNDRDGKPDFAAQASIEANAGIGFDCNFYHFDQQSAKGHFLGPIGNFTGSGLPMKFINSAGHILSIYQSLTQLPDEQWGQGNLFGNFKVLLDRSLDHEVYTFINVNLHTDRWVTWSRKEGMQLIDYANHRGVPLWTAKRTLRFLERRNEAEFDVIRWSNNELSFEALVPAGEDELTVMLPRTFGSKTLALVSLDEKNVPCSFQSVKGEDYAMIGVSSGDRHLVAKYEDR